MELRQLGEMQAGAAQGLFYAMAAIAQSGGVFA
jgi:hypothetical protein